jgi:uncharacterized protein (DUF1778 family)
MARTSRGGCHHASRSDLPRGNLVDHARIDLRGPDRDAFLVALAKPAKPMRRLVSAMKRHAKLSSK